MQQTLSAQAVGADARAAIALTAVPLIQLNDGNAIPQLGFGVWQVPDDKATPAVAQALASGYRLIDTAQGYDNEEGVGRALQDGIDRAALFVTSKLRTKALGYDEALRGYDESLQKLGLDRLDMFLIHWPAPKLDKYVDTWRAFVRLKQEGRVDTIGVSNFLPEHLERIIGETGVTPAVNQIETHPQYQQRSVREFHRRHNIQIESYSPLGSGAVLKNPEIAAIARKHGKSPAQVILRWHIQEELVVIPKSVTPDRIRENLDIFDFELDADDLRRIAGLDDPENGKTGSKPDEFNDLF
jgi:2,5-diketo-D-gluconate reductase A